MREFYVSVFAVCVVLIGTEAIAKLFPEKSGSLIRALTVLVLLLMLANGIVRWKTEASFDFFLPETEETETVFAQSYAEKGTAFLKERLSLLLQTAGADVPPENIEIWYTQNDAGEITIERVRVRVEFSSDTDRVYAVLHGALTDAIPTEVYV